MNCTVRRRLRALEAAEGATLIAGDMGAIVVVGPRLEFLEMRGKVGRSLDLVHAIWVSEGVNTEKMGLFRKCRERGEDREEETKSMVERNRPRVSGRRPYMGFLRGAAQRETCGGVWASDGKASGRLLVRAELARRPHRQARLATSAICIIE